jgi:hypothetical protein
MKIIKKIINNNFYLSLLLFVLFSSYVLYLLFTLRKGFIDLDGWYYSNIARSIIEGHGYANPFRIHTGPTAWVPPFLVYMFIAIFKVIGDRTIGMAVVHLIQMAGFSLTFYYILKIWDLTNIKKNNLLLLIVYLIFIYLNKYHVFRQISDLWNNMLFICMAIFAISDFIKNGKSFYLLILLSIIIPLGSPVIAPFYVSSMVLLFVSELNIKYLKIFERQGKSKIPKIILIGGVFLFSISTWTYRNYVVFHKFIPTKSNQWFEFYLCNVKDVDGLLSESVVVRYHPDQNRSTFQNEILSKNELGWMEQYQTISQDYLKQHKQEYHKKILRRAYNVYVFTQIDDDMVYSNYANNLRPGTLDTLRNEYLIKDNRWECLETDSMVVKSKLAEIVPQNYKEILSDWRNANQSLYNIRHSLRAFSLGLLMGIIPLLSLIWLVIFHFKKNSVPLIIIAIFYIIYPLPYIIISHELRYQQPLIGLQSLIITMAIASILYKISIFNRKQKSYDQNSL